MDILLSSGDIAMSEDDILLTRTKAESIAQAIAIRLRSFRGDWFLNTSFGIDYFEQVFRKPVRQRRIEDIYKREIKAVDGVDEIVSFSLSVDIGRRVAVVRFSARITDGSEVSDEVVVAA